MTRKRGVLIAGAVLVFIGGFFVHAYTSVGEHCDFTGSRRSWTLLPLGLKVNQSYKTSALESYIAKNHPEELEHRWVSYAGDAKNLYGLTFRRGHGSPNGLYFTDYYMKRFVDEGKPDEIKRFYDLLRTASYEDAETQEEIDAKLKYIREHFPLERAHF